MNRRRTLPILLVVLAVILACRPQVTPTPASTSPAVILPTPTETPPTPTERPSPTSPVPLPAAAPRLHAGDPVILNLISMHSENRGWAISGADILTTTDGGQTWGEVTPPEDLSSPADATAYGAFLDANTAWIIFAENNQIVPEASVWHTSDAGHTWTRGAALLHQVYGDRLWAEFAVLDADTLWVLIRGVYVGAGTHFVHELFRSTNGGLTWTSAEDQFSNDFTGMTFHDESFGVRTLETMGAYYFDLPTFDLTTDGGSTWDSNELPAPPDFPDLFDTYPYCETYQPVLLSSDSIRMLLGCVDSEYTPVDFASYLYASEDGGTTWQTTRLPEAVQASLYQMIYFGDDQVLLLGREIYRSTTDGHDWHFVTTVNWDGQFSFVDDQNGWAVGRGSEQAAIARTEDGAATWSLIVPVIAP
jgi:photosystem II stability/assembly factor-like uncharacterized protein